MILTAMIVVGSQKFPLAKLLLLPAYLFSKYSNLVVKYTVLMGISAVSVLQEGSPAEETINKMKRQLVEWKKIFPK